MSNSKQKNAIVVFAKAPVAGKVKTRLQPFMTPQDSARLQEALIKDSILKLSRIDSAEKFIYYWPDEKRNMLDKFIEGTSFHLQLQKGNDLGEKMENAFIELFNKGFFKIVIIGADSPTLPVEYIDQAFDKLDNSEMVIGPSIDGGYYLIGLKEKNYPVFSFVEWGSDKVLSQTHNLVKKHNIKLLLLPTYFDIDTTENIRFLKNHLQLLKHSEEGIPANTTKILDELLRSGVK